MSDGKTEGKNLLRQQTLENKILEDRGKKPLGTLMRESGYTEAYSRNPQQLIQTDNWKSLMEKYYPDKFLAKKHKQLLSFSKIDHYIFPNSMSDAEIGATIDKVKGAKLIRIHRNAAWARAFFTYPDGVIQTENLALAYRTKGKLQPEKVENTVEVVFVTKYGESATQK